MSAPSPSGWTCLWKLKEQTVRETQPPIHTQLRCCVVWFNFTIKGEGGALQTCPISPQLCQQRWLAHTHKHGLVVRDGGVRSKRGYLWCDIIRPGDGALCHALFGFPAAETPGLGKHVREGSDWCTRAVNHTFSKATLTLWQARYCTDPRATLMRSASEKWKGRWSQLQMKARIEEKLSQG